MERANYRDVRDIIKITYSAHPFSITLDKSLKDYSLYIIDQTFKILDSEMSFSIPFFFREKIIP